MRVRGTAERRGSKKSNWGGGIAAEEMSSFVWVNPVLVVQIGFQEWTKELRLRHPKYLGLRPDKSAEEVYREG
jgi:ATP-dependent DNA ligase